MIGRRTRINVCIVFSGRRNREDLLPVGQQKGTKCGFGLFRIGDDNARRNADVSRSVNCATKSSNVGIGSSSLAVSAFAGGLLLGLFDHFFLHDVT